MWGVKMSLVDKYRPKNLDDVIGNQTIIKSLKSKHKLNEIPKQLMFIGTRGCGKTTLARIIAGLVGGVGHGIIEVNSSNNRGIDTAKEIIRDCHFSPIEGKSKVYILDETHMATKDFQNAMLKVIEEPPENVYFIICTTDSKKIIKTIHSRCTKYEVSVLKRNDMITFLEGICDKENITNHESVLEAIYEESEGIPRNALKLLDKIKGIEDAGLNELIECVRSSVDGSKEAIELCRALSKDNSWKTISDILKNLNEDPEGIRRMILGYFSKVLLNTGSRRAYTIIKLFKDDFFDSGKAKLIAACYKTVNMK
jgi:DNA polymerase-3 subunit gamma/tau